MSTRRPRVKAAAILKPRRPQSSANEPSTSKTVKFEPGTEDVEANGSIVDLVEPTAQEVDVKPTVIKSPNYAFKSDSMTAGKAHMENKPPPDSTPRVSPKNLSPMPSPFRRISTPPVVNVVNRRKSIIANDNLQGYRSPKYIKSPSYSFARDVQAKEHAKSIASPVAKPVDDEPFTPAPVDDECFKSPPFMSPIYTRRVDPSMSPFHDIYGEDYTKSPSSLSNSKFRQRIRATPCFASRRNSIQGNSLGASESEDEQHRRQRHYSTSSNHSNYNPASTPQHPRNYFGLNKVPSRVRTESYSSSISDIPFTKNKRSNRSEEYQRVANAKREFNQRLNGKPPDKSRLTMYDLIYYNPLTNPMTRPAGKGDKSSDTASVSSAKTNQSKSSGSVKSEVSTGPVKTEVSEQTETVTGPVPQLKLDANGEIILDEKSLVIETTVNKEAREKLANSDIVYDDEFSGTSGFYKRQKRTRDWLPLETLKFYRSLQTIGTDFSVMLQLFPNRSRRDLKLKFKKEEKHNMALINKALLHPKEFNVDELKLQFDKEDEEIEQKKQEWTEVRKKMATERREQLNASKRRNSNKQLSRTIRTLTDGDNVYENEFVTLPPRSKRINRKRNVQADQDHSIGRHPTGDPMLSPLSLNHNNNHVDTFPQHTYATHKLPNFTEMISSRNPQYSPSDTKLRTNPNPPSQPDTPIDCSNNNSRKDTHIESNGTYSNDVSLNAIDLSAASLVIHGSKPADQSRNGNIQIGEESTIGQYIANNPNLTFKGTGDIMNMDIIFENVSIEEDETIGSADKSNTPIAIVAETPIVTAISDSQIDGVYEIITLNDTKPENNSQVNDVSTDSLIADLSDPVEQVVVVTEGIVDPDFGGNYEYNSSEVIIMPCSSLDVAAEVETFDANAENPDDWSEEGRLIIDLPVASTAEEDNNHEIIVKETPNTTIKVETVVKTETPVKTQSPIKTESPVKAIQMPVQNSDGRNERKRKRKIVPLLTSNKRTRKNNQVVETKDEPVPSEQTTSVTPHHSPVKSNEIQENPSTPNDSPKVYEPIEQTVNDEAANESNNDTQEQSFMDSLVVVESQDPNDPNKTIHEVYMLDPETNELSDKPLDLPTDVIQRIRLAMS